MLEASQNLPLTGKLKPCRVAVDFPFDDLDGDALSEATIIPFAFENCA